MCKYVSNNLHYNEMYVYVQKIHRLSVNVKWSSEQNNYDWNLFQSPKLSSIHNYHTLFIDKVL